MTDIDIFMNGDADLSSTALSLPQQEWLIGRMLRREESAKSLAKRFNLNRKKLNKWAFNARKGMKKCISGGRPRIFDKGIMLELAEFSGSAQPNELKDYISSAYKELRAGQKEKGRDCASECSKCEEKKISKRTLRRYMELCTTQQILQYV